MLSKVKIDMSTKACSHYFRNRRFTNQYLLKQNSYVTPKLGKNYISEIKIKILSLVMLDSEYILKIYCLGN